jgi:hypothetical protein
MSDGQEKRKRLGLQRYSGTRRHRKMIRYVSNNTGRNCVMRRFHREREPQVAVSTVRG